MTALSADAQRASREPGIRAYPVEAGEVIYKGAIVALDADGFLIPATNTAGLQVVGVAEEKADNTGGADGAIDVKVRSDRAFKFTATSITQAMLGDMMYVVDDNTVDDVAGASNAIPVGRLVEFVSTTEGWVYIPDGGMPVPEVVDPDTSAYDEAGYVAVLAALAKNGLIDDNHTT